MKKKKINGVMRRYGAVFCAVVLLAAAIISGPTTFSDVPKTYWAHNEITEAAKHNWVNGIGNNMFAPENEVTVSQWLVMVTRATDLKSTYEPAASNEWYSGKWYSRNVELAIEKNYGSFLPEDIFKPEEMNRPMNRAEMACVVASVLVEHGYRLNSADVPYIPDLDELHVSNGNSYANGVKMTYSHGIIKGVDNTGRFNGYANMTRAQAAAVLCRMMDKLDGKGETTEPITPTPTPTPTPVVPDPKPVVPTPTPDPVVPQEPTGNYGPVGTMSNNPVTLSYKTHKPVTDYWAQNSEAFKSQVDRDAYNAAVQSLKDYQYSSDFYRNNRYSRNEYYNYAVFNYEMGDMKTKNTLGMIRNSGIMGFGNIKGTDTRFWSTNLLMDVSDRDYMPYVNRITDDMSDREAVKICMQAMVDNWVYGSGGDAWMDNKDVYTGYCGELARAYQEVLAAAGIPSIYSAAGDHAWTYILVDGQWYLSDPTIALQLKDSGDINHFTFSDVHDYDDQELAGNPELRFDVDGSPANVAARFIEQAGFHR